MVNELFAFIIYNAFTFNEITDISTYKYCLKGNKVVSLIPTQTNTN